jgi:hypothetical protein
MAESAELHIHNYDGAAVWSVEAYDRRSEALLRSLGATQAQSPYDGAYFDCTPQQICQYVAGMAGLNVEFPKRKKRTMTDEQRARLAERMRSINRHREAVLSVG